MDRINTTGRRKTSVARVYITDGNGAVTINKKDLNDYFPTPQLQASVNLPFVLTDNTGKFDLNVNVSGGGINGQAEAIQLGIARALCEIDAENRLKLKPKGLLTRDSRMVERKKSGQKKARKKFQFSKR